jgi:hypothetical protein
MIKIVTGLATILLLSTNANADDKKPFSKHKFFGFSQIGLQAGDGAIQNSQNAKLTKSMPRTFMTHL